MASSSSSLTKSKISNDPERQVTLSAEDVARLNPNTRTCPIFRSRRGADLTKAIYRRIPVLIRESQGVRPLENPWGIKFKQGLFNMTSDSNLFRTREQLAADGWQLEGNIFCKGGDRYLPLFEGKLTGIFNHRAGTFEEVPQADAAKGNERETSLVEKTEPSLSACPRYWVAGRDVTDGYGDTCKRFWLTFHDIANPNNERTFIGTLIPGVAVGNTLGICLFDPILPADLELALSANLNSLVLDYVSRLKISSRHFNFFIVQQLPIVPPSTYSRANPWAGHAQGVGGWLLPRALELTYTAWDLRPFAQECGWSGPPFRWDEERRFLLRCELDAAFFHFYMPAELNGDWRPAEGETAEDLARLKASFPTPRDAVAYIMDTFPIVRRNDEASYGEYRTKHVILEVYDALAISIRTGQPYQTRLDPPPADPRCCHPPKEGSKA